MLFKAVHPDGCAQAARAEAVKGKYSRFSRFFLCRAGEIFLNSCATAAFQRLVYLRFRRIYPDIFALARNQAPGAVLKVRQPTGAKCLESRKKLLEQRCTKVLVKSRN